MTNNLPKALLREPFTFEEALKQGLTQYSIRKLLELGTIERLERGLYRSVGEDLSDEESFRRAVKLVGNPAAVCLLSALSHYELIDTIPREVWLMVPKEKRAKSSRVRLYRARDPMWKVGINSKEGYAITSIERTIVDALTLKAVVPLCFGIEALNVAIAKKKTSAHKVLQMARTLNVKHRVLPYIEAIL